MELAKIRPKSFLERMGQKIGNRDDHEYALICELFSIPYNVQFSWVTGVNNA